MENLNRFRLVVAVVAFAVIGQSALALTGREVMAEESAQETVQERVLSETSVGSKTEMRIATVTLSSVVAAGSYLNYGDEARTAKARSETRVRSLHKTTPDQLHPYMRTTQTMLEEALPGDVIHFEYHVRGIAELRIAEEESRATWELWEKETKRINDAIRVARTREELKPLYQRLGYADARQHRARGLYSAMHLNRTAAEEGLKHGRSISGSYVVYREFIVGKNTDLEIFDFLKTAFGYGSAQSLQAKVPHVIVKRTDFANAKVATKAARAAKLGLVGAFVSAAFVIEEISEGKLAEALAEEKLERR